LAHTRGMGRPPLSIDVTPKDQKELAKLLSGGVQQVRVVLRALALVQLPKAPSAHGFLGRPAHFSGHPLDCASLPAGGLESALFEKQRPAQPRYSTIPEAADHRYGV